MSVANRLYRRVMMAIAPVKITATDDTGPVHRAQIRGFPNETIDAMPALQPTASPRTRRPAPTQWQSSARATARMGAIIATGNQQFRLRELEGGRDRASRQRRLNRQARRWRKIEITCTGSVAVTAPSVTIADKDGGNATVAITGNLTATGEITARAGGAAFVTLSGHVNHQGGGPNNPPRPGT